MSAGFQAGILGRRPPGPRERCAAPAWKPAAINADVDVGSHFAPRSGRAALFMIRVHINFHFVQMTAAVMRNSGVKTTAAAALNERA